MNTCRRGLNAANALTALVLLAALLMGAMLARSAQPRIASKERFQGSEIEAAKESIALSLMGQVQFTVGSLMWLKTLEYLHNGASFRMPTEAEERKGQQAVSAVDVAGGLAHQDGVAMTLSPETDWRGPIGTLNRQIMPYLLAHRHSDPKELIPWYKLALRFNPNLERLYVLGAFFMSDFAHEPDEALELLQAGVQANPWSFEIPAALGRLYFEVLKDNEKAISTLKNSVANGKRESASLAERKEKFDDYQKQLFKESYLFLARAYTEQGEYDDALATCDEGLKESGDHMLVVQRRITEKRRDEKGAPPSANKASSGS